MQKVICLSNHQIDIQVHIMSGYRQYFHQGMIMGKSKNQMKQMKINKYRVKIRIIFTIFGKSERIFFIQGESKKTFFSVLAGYSVKTFFKKII